MGGTRGMGDVRARPGGHRARDSRSVQLGRPAIAAALLTLAEVVAIGGVVGVAVVAAGVTLVLLGLLAQQRLPVGDRDLVVVRVDLVEGEEAVPVAAVLDEGRLQAGFDARDLGAPGRSRSIDNAQEPLVDLVAVGKKLVEIHGTDHRADIGHGQNQ